MAKVADEQQPEEVVASSFNINDGSFNVRPEEELQRDRAAPGRKSPAPSVISTASSGSPLIRNNSASSNDSQSRWQHSVATKSNQQQANGGGVGSHFKRPAPTSIAAAQLQQQQQLQQPQNNNQLSDKKHSSRSSPTKHQSGNKLAHMAKLSATGQHDHLTCAIVDQRVKSSFCCSNSGGPDSDASNKSHQAREKPKKKPSGGEGAKSFGYTLGKTLAQRANRFNEFWSMNKMRYMNLACLLMTLVCLLTILLFSKTKLIATRSEPEQLNGKQISSMASTVDEDPFKMFGRKLDQEKQKVDDQEDSAESLDSIDRQQLARNYRRYLMKAGLINQKDDDDDEQATSNTSGNQEDEVTTRATNSADGFNLFDERHEESTDSSPSSKRSLADDLLQDARKQLRHQQETELEMEDDANTLSKSLLTPNSSSVASSRPIVVSVDRRASPFLQDPISQVLQDLDGFGLFKSIKSRLVDQFNLQNLTARPVEVTRTKNGAAIIMSFDSQNNATGSNRPNETFGPASETMPSFLRTIFPSLFDTNKRSPSGFAAVSLNAEPTTTLSFRASGAPIGGAIFESSSSAVNPFLGPQQSSFGFPPLPPFILPTPGYKSASASQGPSGFMSMILRASNELANQMRQQMMEQAGNQTTDTSGQTNSTADKHEQQASQQVKVIQLISGLEAPNRDSKNGTTTTKQQAASNISTDNELETLDATRSINSLRPIPSAFEMSPFHSIYSRRRSFVPQAGGGSMLMIESTSGVPSTILTGESSSGLFGPSSSSSSLFGDNQPPLMLPFPLMPKVFLVGGHQQHERAGRFGPMGPMLRSILGNVMSDLTQSTVLNDETAPRKGTSSPAASRRDDHQEEAENEWDELATSPFEAANKLSRARSKTSDDSPGDLMDDSSENSAHIGGDHQNESAEGVKFPGGSFFEQMLGQLNGARPTQLSWQTMRGPNGLTVHRRLIGMSTLNNDNIGDTQTAATVAPGVRSQSLKRMDSLSDKFYTFTRISGPGQTDSNNQISSSERPSALASFVRMLDQKAANERQDDSSAISSLRLPRARSFRSPRRHLEAADQMDEEDHDSVVEFHGKPKKWGERKLRAGTGRIHLLSSRSDLDLSPPLQRRPDFLPMSTEPINDERAEHNPPATIQRLPSRPFVSPNSPLFGFPVLKSEQTPVDSHQQAIAARLREKATSGQRRQRSFVYHSNHEIAQAHGGGVATLSGRQQAAPRNGQDETLQPESLTPESHNHQQQQASLPPVVMGRRLDDPIERR